LDIVAQGKNIPTLKECIKIGTTFCLTVFAWIFFRANNLQHAIDYIRNIFKNSLFKIPYFPGIGMATPFFIFLIVFILIEWLNRESLFAIQHLGKTWSAVTRWSFYFVLILIIYYYSLTVDAQQFIYFQF
jgi:hypothetical protein